ncbi:MAG: hypothetical protein CL398_04255 [Acidiferrobacteraceae bacterium]|nr:hypothetical protein [Acidiferrobacteraceae bacterium]|tara:strand:- start:314 stop:1210 length:897 start_codon:yes stop_codon:yes gene_type:complete
MENPKNILIFGANSDIGSYLCPQLIADGWIIDSITTRARRNNDKHNVRLFLPSDYRKLVANNMVAASMVISLMPIWKLPDYRDILEAIGARKLIAISSTSILSKANSTNTKEQLIAAQLHRGEQWVNQNFSSGKRSALILRPTMIYGGARNRNINRLAKLIRIFKFFPMTGEGAGLRQPVHAKDIADLCLDCASNGFGETQTYILAGGETLTYRNIIERLFIEVGLKPRIITIPAPILRITLNILKSMPNNEDLTPEMLKRMEENLCYDHSDAISAFGWSPRQFQPSSKSFKILHHGE